MSNVTNRRGFLKLLAGVGAALGLAPREREPETHEWELEPTPGETWSEVVDRVYQASEPIKAGDWVAFDDDSYRCVHRVAANDSFPIGVAICDSRLEFQEPPLQQIVTGYEPINPFPSPELVHVVDVRVRGFYQPGGSDERSRE